MQKCQNLHPIWAEGLSAPFSGTVEVINTYTIFKAEEANVNAFNHHPIITSFKQKVYIAFSTHMNTEDANGQYARYASSEDGGMTWSEPIVILEPQCEPDSIKTKQAVRPAAWAVINNELYSIMHIIRGGMMAIKVNDDNSFGEPFWIYPIDDQPKPLENKSCYMYDSVLGPEIMNFLMKTENFPVRGRPEKYFNFTSGFIEPSGITLPSGYEILLWRSFRRLKEDRENNNANKRKYLQYRYGSTGTFSKLYESEIIDSRSITIWKSLSDGKIGLMGNDTDANRTAVYYTEADPYELKFYPVYNVLQNIDYNVKFPGGGKNGGASYIDFTEHDNNIICVYSERKEDIKVTIFRRP